MKLTFKLKKKKNLKQSDNNQTCIGHGSKSIGSRDLKVKSRYEGQIKITQDIDSLNGQIISGCCIPKIPISRGNKILMKCMLSFCRKLHKNSSFYSSGNDEYINAWS